MKQIFEFLIFHECFCVYDRFLSFEARSPVREMTKVIFLLGGAWKMFCVQSVLSYPYQQGDGKINLGKDNSGVKWILIFPERS